MAGALLGTLTRTTVLEISQAVSVIRHQDAQRDASPPEALAIGTALWMISAEKEYFRRVQTIRKVRLPFFDNDWYEQYIEDPLRFPIDAIGSSVTGWSLIWRVQPEPELEQARKLVVFRIWVTIAMMVVVMVGLAVLALLAS